MGLLFSGIALAGPAPDRLVDDDLAECPAAGYTTVADAVAAALPGEVIEICPGTYGEPVMVVDVPLTLVGSGTGNTFIESAGADQLFLVESGGFAIRDLTLRNAVHGLRFENAGATLDDVEVLRVRFENHSSRAVEIHNSTTVTNMRVTDSQFVNSPHGIRSASSGVVDGLTITGCTFTDLSIGIYQANGDSTGYLRNLQVTGSTFVRQATAGIFAEEIRDALIEDNEFASSLLGVFVAKQYTTAGVPVENVMIRGNTFTDSTAGALSFRQLTSALAGPVDFVENTIVQDAGLMALDFGLVDFRLDSNFTHGPVSIVDNRVTFTGALTGGATALHAVKLRGNLSDVLIEANQFEGGGIGDLGGLPPSSAVFIQTDDPTYGPLTPASVVDLLCNTMTGFVNGVSVYDSVAGLPGGVPAGAAVTMRGNRVSGNSGLGVDNSGTSEILDANGNWWGDASGPSGFGPGTGDAISANVTASSFITIPVSQCGSLTLTKVDSADPVGPGDTLDYTVTVANAGPGEAVDVVVTESLPAGLSSPVTSGCAEDPAGVPVCSLGTIAPGTSAQYTVSVGVELAAVGVVNNVVAVTADGLDSNPGDNTVSETTTVVAADLVLVKQATVEEPLEVGDTFTFDLMVTNQGPNDATNVVVTDPLPPEVDFVSSPCATFAAGVVTWTIGDLAVGASAGCSLSVTATVLDTIINVATVAADQVDPELANNTSSVSLVGASAIPVLDSFALVVLAALIALAGARALRRVQGPAR